ncbi:hypothetical protein FNH22_28505 [Fulvivirga sp. M361]|uniref:helix-turn-helix domain-containing protein n=1 Tax=Fulvivirga sp. M361 TaxID=2594266 RepID=UPI00117B0FDA|nr:LuxR C-terminal-related transcriptional regulator [Fulvivirga sp. M361]TRX48706.1 hypothetical protein FNH22_28505 [Fulvivirga sp. M361]
MTSTKNISYQVLLTGLIALIVVSVLIFNVFYFSTYYGFVQVNYINSLLLMPFLALVLSFGIILGRSQPPEKWTDQENDPLTVRETEIVELIIQGKRNQEIANQLFVELSTVKSHINNIYKKTEVKDRKELIKITKRK